MRYFFISPTIWVDEISRIMQIWATYLAAAYVLKHHHMIVIEVAFKTPGTTARKIVDSFALLVIIVFSVVALWYGFELWWKATVRGHTTDSYLAPPKWLTHASVWVGFTLLTLQAGVEIFKIWSKNYQSHARQKSTESVK